MAMLECHSSHNDFIKLGGVVYSNIYHICSSVSTLLVVAAVATLLLLSTFWFLGGLWATTAPYSIAASGLYIHIQNIESLAGQEDLPGACNFVQLLHAC